MQKENFINFYKVDSKKNLLEFLRKTAKTQGIRVVVLSFAANDKLSEKSVYDAEILELLRSFRIPIISTIKGFAKGFLIEVIIFSHICISADFSKFETNYINKFKHLLGRKNSHKLSSLKETIDVKTALDIGIINEIVKEENLESKAFELAETISNLAPIAIRFCLKAVNEGLEMNLQDGLKLETELFSSIFETEDMKEGTSAFLEKRKPNFIGK